MEHAPSVSLESPVSLKSDPAASVESSLSRLTELVGSAWWDSGAAHAATEGFHPTDAQIKAELDHVRRQELSSELAGWVDRYGEYGARNPYLWAWCRQGVEITTLPSVPQPQFDHVCDTKVLGVMFDVLIDDVADRGGDICLLDQLIGLADSQPLNTSQLAPEDRDYARFAEAVWSAISQRIASLPRYSEFADFLRYDYAQLLNAMRYAHLLNRFPSMLNMAEHDLYLPHNMHMMVSATIDLMASPDFDFSELGRLREAIWNAQYMGRIGNLVSTWQREIGERDYTSGVFARAVTLGDLRPGDLSSAHREHVEKVLLGGNHEAYFLNRWQAHRQYLLALSDTIESVDLLPLIAGLERLICLHLGSRGLK